jgi:hypothetical protein
MALIGPEPARAGFVGSNIQFWDRFTCGSGCSCRRIYVLRWLKRLLCQDNGSMGNVPTIPYGCGIHLPELRSPVEEPKWRREWNCP